MKQFENFFYKMENFGYYVFDSVLSAQELINIRKDLLNHQEYCKSIYSKNGITEGMDGCAHHTIGKNDSIDDFLYNFYLDDYIRAYFDSEYILNTIGGINNIPHTNNAYEHGLNFIAMFEHTAGILNLCLTTCLNDSSVVRERPHSSIFMSIKARRWCLFAATKCL